MKKKSIITTRTVAGGSNLTRRNFLKMGSIAVTGLSLSRNQLLAADTVDRKIHIGVVGGNFGSHFYWHEHPNCIVEAVSDLRPARRDHLMKTYQCSKSYNSLEELVKDKKVDAVAVFTEGPNHAKHVIEVLKHGKHAICAVPACAGSGVEEAQRLLDAVKESGLTYMMAETSFYQQHTISARQFYQEKKFGEIYYCESEYQHSGLEVLFFENGKPTWRHGFPPMLYPTHCIAHLTGVTGEKLTEVVCHGWGDESDICKKNAYNNNPFWNESAMFRTDHGHAFRVNIWWKGAHRGCERAQWIGSDMSFYAAHPNGLGPVIVRPDHNRTEKDDAGFLRYLPELEPYEQPDWWDTDLLPEPLRHNSGHQGSHTFLTHEFIDALIQNRQPAIDITEALAYTVPGIVAHESALRGGELLKIPQLY
jgi:predicted dehydrogenase